MATLRTVTLIIISCTLVLVTHAQITDSRQNARLEKYIFNAQIGFLSICAYGERRLSNHSSLRAELGISASWDFGSYFKPSYFIMIAPRWYYNLNRRVRRSKDITNNKGDFLFLQVGYLSNSSFFFPSSEVAPAIIIVPAWGMRRAISRRINYEIGIGMGSAIVSNIGFFEQSFSRPCIHLRLRIEYRFNLKKKK